MVLQQLLKAFERYYTIQTEQLKKPFAAEAQFHSHTEHYLLVKAAQIAESEDHEFVFFIQEPKLSLPRLKQLCELTWQEGLGRVHPHIHHRNSDITLVIVADEVEKEVWTQIKRISYVKAHRFSLHGWSHFKLLVYQPPSAKTASNRLGKDLEKIIQKITNTQEKK